MILECNKCGRRFKDGFGPAWGEGAPCPGFPKWGDCNGVLEMPADLKNPFDESCCDGGKCEVKKESAQPCGCDAGANWVCMYHKTLKEVEDAKTKPVPDVQS